MKLILCFISVLLFVVNAQNLEESARNFNKIKIFQEVLCDKYALERTNQELRGIRDVWNKIKESAIQSWNYIKGVAEQTKASIQLWVQSVQEYAYQIKQDFEQKLENLKQRFNDIIDDIYETGAQLKQCLAKEQENMGIFLKTVMQIMSECIFDEVKKLPNADVTPQLELNQTKFTKELEEKVEHCENNVENYQGCIYKARDDIFDNFAIMEKDILKTHYETRGVVDEIKSTLLSCSLNHLVDATNFITNKALEVINCVKEEKYDEIDDQNNNEIE